MNFVRKSNALLFIVFSNSQMFLSHLGTVDRSGKIFTEKTIVQEKGNRDDLINSEQHPKYKAPPPPPRQRRTSSSSTTIKASTLKYQL